MIKLVKLIPEIKIIPQDLAYFLNQNKEELFIKMWYLPNDVGQDEAFLKEYVSFEAFKDAFKNSSFKRGEYGCVMEGERSNTLLDNEGEFYTPYIIVEPYFYDKFEGDYNVINVKNKKLRVRYLHEYEEDI